MTRTRSPWKSTGKPMWRTIAAITTALAAVLLFGVIPSASAQAAGGNAVKPIGTFSANAQCVRGHIPITLNTGLGRVSYRNFIKAVRLLNKNPFWMNVTS